MGQIEIRVTWNGNGRRAPQAVEDALDDLMSALESMDDVTDPMISLAVNGPEGE